MFFLGDFITAISPTYDDDSTDRLNFFITTWILVFFALLCSANNYVGEPLQCWPPAEFQGGWEQYAENYCFVKNTYFWPITKPFPPISERKNYELKYYQWVPFILALQAFLFFAPELFWRLLNPLSGIRLKEIMGMIKGAKNIEDDTRQKNVNIIACHIHDCLNLQRMLPSKGRGPMAALFYGKHSGSYVTVLYIVVKILFVVNVVGQFFMLNRFLGFEDGNLWGYDVLHNLATGHDWTDTGQFPRVTFCDFDVRTMGSIEHYTLQCVLMINMYNEKIFVFIWWWMFFLAILTVFNFIKWLYYSTPASMRGFIKGYLELLDKNRMRKFINECLRRDGVTMMRLVAGNAGDVMTTDLMHAVWLKYLEQFSKKPAEKNDLVEKQLQLLDEDVVTPLERKVDRFAGAVDDATKDFDANLLDRTLVASLEKEAIGLQNETLVARESIDQIDVKRDDDTDVEDITGRIEDFKKRIDLLEVDMERQRNELARMQ